MKTFQIGNFEIILKLNNNKILIELIDVVSNNILKKEFNKEQIIVNVINPLDIEENNNLTTTIFTNLNITEIYNMCNNIDNLKEYEFVDDINGYFLGNIENKHNKLSIIKNEHSIKLLFNCETNNILQIEIIFEIYDSKTINSYRKNKIEDKINNMEDKINNMEDKINNIKKYDIHLLPEVTLNTIILTLIITGCISNMIKTIYKK